MDRRRFVPSTEGLEGRKLLSLFGGPSTTAGTQRTIANFPDTIRMKYQRIEHLPYFLQQLDTKNPLPTAPTVSLQNDLVGVVGNLHAANSNILNSFNLGLRHAYPHRSIYPTDAARLNRAFGEALSSAGATDAQVASLKADMNLLTQAATHSADPVVVSSNEYAIVLQVGLAVGRPIKTPTAPRLAQKQGFEAKGGAYAVTPLHQPILTGQYNVGVTDNASTKVQIVDTASGGVVATGQVVSTGTYQAKVNPALPDGTYKLAARAVDNTGHESLLSPAITVRIYTRQGRTPVGTLA